MSSRFFSGCFEARLEFAERFLEWGEQFFQAFRGLLIKSSGMIHEKLVRDGFEISAKLCLNGFNLLPFCFETLIEKFNLRFKLAVPFLEGKQLFLELGKKPSSSGSHSLRDSAQDFRSAASWAWIEAKIALCLHQLCAEAVSLGFELLVSFLGCGRE